MFIFAFVIGMMAMANTIEKKDSQTLPEVSIQPIKNEGVGVKVEAEATYTCTVSGEVNGQYFEGTASSNISMKDACRKALAKALKDIN